MTNAFKANEARLNERVREHISVALAARLKSMAPAERAPHLIGRLEVILDDQASVQQPQRDSLLENYIISIVECYGIDLCHDDEWTDDFYRKSFGFCLGIMTGFRDNRHLQLPRFRKSLLDIMISAWSYAISDDLADECLKELIELETDEKESHLPGLMRRSPVAQARYRRVRNRLAAEPWDSPRARISDQVIDALDHRSLASISRERRARFAALAESIEDLPEVFFQEIELAANKRAVFLGLEEETARLIRCDVSEGEEDVKYSKYQAKVGRYSDTELMIEVTIAASARTDGLVAYANRLAQEFLPQILAEQAIQCGQPGALDCLSIMVYLVLPNRIGELVASNRRTNV